MQSLTEQSETQVVGDGVETGSGSLVDRLCAAMDANRKAVWLAVLIVYLAGFNGQWRVEPDSALYLSLGRNLATGAGYTYQGEPHNLVYPGLPWMLSFCFGVFGESRGMVMANVLMLACGLGALWCTYRFVTMAVSRGLGVCVVAGLAGTFLFHRYCYQIMTDMPFVLGATAALAGYERLMIRRDWRSQESLLLPAGVMVMVLTRPAAWALVPPLAMGMLYHCVRLVTRTHLAAVLTCIGLLAAAVAAYVGAVMTGQIKAPGMSGGNYEAFVIGQASKGSEEYLQKVWQNFVELFQQIFTEAVLGFEAYFVGNIVVAVAVLGSVVAAARIRPMWGAWVAGTLAMMILVLPVDRYLLGVLPIFVASWMLAVRDVSRWVHQRESAGQWPGKLGRWLVIGMLGIGLAVNVPKVIGHIAEQYGQPFIEVYKGGRYKPTVEAAKAVAIHVPADGLVLSPYKTDRIISFYSRRRALPTISITPTPAGASKVYVVVDEADAEQRRFLEERGITLGAKIADIPGRPKRKGWILVEAILPGTK